MSTPTAPTGPVPPAEPGDQALSVPRQWVALAVLMLPVLIISIDNTVLGFAVPELSEALDPTASQLLWIVDAYAFMVAGLLITMGNLGDRIGRRRLLMVGAAAFGAASVLAAFSTTAAMLIVARALLGAAGATLMPSTLSLIRNIFDEPNRRRTAVGIWVATFSVGASIGPIVGGWLLTHYWWGSVFLVNLPIMIVLLVVAPLLLPESRNDRPGRFDWVSSPLSLLAVVPGVYALKIVAEHGFSSKVAIAAIVSIAAGVVFVRRQRVVEEPMLDLDLLAERTFAVAIGTNLLSNMAFVSAVFLLAQQLQVVVGLDALAAGFRLLPGTVASGFASLAAAWLLRKGVPARTVVCSSLALGAAGYLSLVLLEADGGAGVVVFAMVFVGIGIAAASVVGSNVVLAAAPARRAGAASAMSETAFELGAALGIALLGSVLTTTYRRSITLPEGLSPDQADRAAATMAGAVDVASQVPDTTAAAVRGAAEQAFTSGIQATGVVGAVLLATGAVAAGLALRGGAATPVAEDPEGP